MIEQRLPVLNPLPFFLDREVGCFGLKPRRGSTHSFDMVLVPAKPERPEGQSLQNQPRQVITAQAGARGEQVRNNGRRRPFRILEPPRPVEFPRYDRKLHDHLAWVGPIERPHRSPRTRPASLPIRPKPSHVPQMTAARLSQRREQVFGKRWVVVHTADLECELRGSVRGKAPPPATVPRMGRPDLLVIDLDGTLLCADGQVSTENAEAISRAEAAGLTCMIATGRTLSECRGVLDTIAYSGPLIAASGSLLVETNEERTVDRREIDPAIVESVVHLVQEGKAVTMLLKDRCRTGVDYVLVGTASLHPVSEWWFDATGATFQRVDRIEDDPFPDDTVRIGAVGSPDEFAPMVDLVDQRLGSRVLARHWEAVTSSAHAGKTVHLLEVFHPDADKWTMLQSHCREIGLDASRAAAVGDGLNDVMLIEQCGLGVAMENADHSVQAVADAVTDAHHQHGVAVLIDDLLGGRLVLGGARR